MRARQTDLVVMVKVTDSDTGDDDAALNGTISDGRPRDLQRLMAQLALEAQDGSDAGLVDEPVHVRRAAGAGAHHNFWTDLIPVQSPPPVTRVNGFN